MAVKALGAPVMDEVPQNWAIQEQNKEDIPSPQMPRAAGL